METLILNNLQEKLDRSIEERLYQTLLQNNYIPDRDFYVASPATYELKQAEIKNTKGFSIELFGHAVSHDRMVKTVPRITVTGLGFLIGTVGNDMTAYFTDNGETFKKEIGPPTSSLYRFEITLVSNKGAQDRVLESIRATALPNRKYIPVYENPSDNFLINYGALIQKPDVDIGLIQKTYMYEAIDVFENLSQTIATSIAKIREITVNDLDTEIHKSK